MAHYRRLTVEAVIQALEELGGEADWLKIERLVTEKRGGGFEPYADWRNYTTTMRQLLQQHCQGYRKFLGIIYFQKVRARPLRVRLVGFQRKIPVNKPPRHKVAEVESPKLTSDIRPAITPKAEDITEPPTRVESTTYRILRDTALSREIKGIHDYKCQVCHSDGLQLGKGRLYAEIHHIKPLGAPHNGLDVRENVLCVCPNCHVLLDYGAIQLDASKLRVSPKHKVGKDYIDYHNRQIVGKANDAG